MIGNVVINTILQNEGLKAGTFARKIGITPTQVYDIQSGKIKKISFDIAEKIVKEFPEYSKSWILTAEGNIYNDTFEGCHLYTFLLYTGLTQVEFSKKTGIDIIELYKILANRKELDIATADKIKSAFPQVNKDWLLSSNGDMIIGDDDIQKELRKESRDALEHFYTRLLPTSAIGGSLTMQADGVLEYECEKVISPIPNADFAIPIYGESMAPEYPNGSRVFIKRVNPSVFIEYNRIYVLDTSNGVVIKKIMPSDKEGYVKCVSLNPEFLPFDVHMDEINGWFKVLGCLTINM